MEIIEQRKGKEENEEKIVMDVSCGKI